MIGFWVNDREEVDRIAKLVSEYGGTINSGPQLFPISPTNYAVELKESIEVSKGIYK